MVDLDIFLFIFEYSHLFAYRNYSREMVGNARRECYCAHFDDVIVPSLVCLNYYSLSCLTTRCREIRHRQENNYF